MKKLLQVLVVSVMAGWACFSVVGCANEGAKESASGDFVQVESSLLKAVKYDAGSQTLTVKFTSGAMGEYTGVPANVYDELMKSDSKGKYLTGKIKGEFEYKEL